MLDLGHDGVGVKGLCFLLDTVLGEQVCRQRAGLDVRPYLIGPREETSSRVGRTLTLVVDEAVGGQQFEGVDLEQHPVEQKVVSGGTELGVMAQTGLGELLAA